MMEKTSISYCSKCKYATVSGSLKICNYLIDTGQLRNCEVGFCDKRVLGKREYQDALRMNGNQNNDLCK